MTTTTERHDRGLSAPSSSPILLEALELVPSGLWRRYSVVAAVGVGARLLSLWAGRRRMTDGRDAGLSHSLFAANVTLGTLAFGVLVAGAFEAVAHGSCGANA